MARILKNEVKETILDSDKIILPSMNDKKDKDKHPYKKSVKGNKNEK